MDSTNCGERLSLVATMLLGIQLLMIIVADKLPTCGELLWVELLNYCNFLFCVVTLIESCIVVHISFRGVGAVNERLAEDVDAYARVLILGGYTARA